MVAGIREDHNSLYGWFTTPRLNVRYEPVKGTIIRASVRQGTENGQTYLQRTMGSLQVRRQVSIVGSTGNGAYGLRPEIAWNKGITIDQKFKLFNRVSSLGIDFFQK